MSATTVSCFEAQATRSQEAAPFPRPLEVSQVLNPLAAGAEAFLYPLEARLPLATAPFHPLEVSQALHPPAAVAAASSTWISGLT